MEIFLGFILVIAIIGVLFLTRFKKPGSPRRRVPRYYGPVKEDFQREKNQLRPYCSESDFKRFMSFLNRYEGGYIRENRNGTIYRDYLGQEKGDLKGLFFNVIAPNPNLHTNQKEEFRRFAISKGVTGLDDRPDYETRDSALKNRETDADSFERKKVGNIGEQLIRDILSELKNEGFSVINGAKLRSGGITKEFDHIVIGSNGIFVLETKAFGMTAGSASKASLFIDPGDKWILRKNQINHDIESPTEQIMAETEHLSGILRPVSLYTIHPMAVLSNTGLFIKQNIPLDYQVVRADSLTDTIREYHDHLTGSDIRLIIHTIDESRVN